MRKRSEIFIEAKALDYIYPGEEEYSSPALSGINLTVNRGEYVALIGPNGSGKTTLLMLFNALLTPSAGVVKVDGLSTGIAENLTAVRLKCGMIFQNPDNQIVAVTVEEDVAFGLENQALPPAEIRKRVDETLSLLGLEKLRRQPPHMLSGGEKQRVAVAGILAMRPGVILMDEPTAMLDPGGRRDVLSTVRSLNRDYGIAVVHVTHDPEEAACAERVVVLERGRLIGEGPPEMILTDLDLLHSVGLQSTTAAELAALLREDGLDDLPPLIHSRELVENLCSLARKS